MDRSKRMGQGGIPRLLLTFSAPAVVGMLAQALYNIVDRIFVGRAVGATGIAGINVSFPFMLILLAFGMLIGFGATALISIRLGEQKKDEAEKVLGNAAVLLVGVSVLLTTIGLVFLSPLLKLFGSAAGCPQHGFLGARSARPQPPRPGSCQETLPHTVGTPLLTP